ncbi:phosphoserine aminotransferase [Leucobacter luti]|uniref:phosphoserine transaminase n=1 Tax=Leucobacter luti TaxID=340320 RepID=UPI00104B2B61|nr:phosphoserine transaminase [Leucobacter luti]MCW2288766.1 phosphoserine aminotransferase [Leucobacter luti]TCK45082.1 phosphoserine aminotransferase [Leucobacter luti]
MADISIPTNLLPADGRFGCGPSKVRSEQLSFLASLQPGVLGTSHRQAPVKDLVGSVRSGLLDLFRAPEGYEILLANGGATTFWDSAAHSLVEKRSQHLAFGEFGAKFGKATGAAPFLEEPDVRSAEAGSRSQAEAVAGIDVYAYPHNETSTGVMAPVVRVAGDAGALTVVDATSAAGGIDFDASQTDVYYFSPQKNFASDGGIWFALVSPAAIERIERVTTSGRYIPETLNLAGAVENSRKNQTLNTPALATLAMMDEQVRWINEQGGLAWASARTAESSHVLYDWAERTAVATPFVSDPDHRSQVVVTIDFDESVDAAALSTALRANGIVDTEPYRKLGRNQLRVATFTAIEPDDVRALTASIDYVLERLS